MLVLASLPQAQGTAPATPLTLITRDGRRPVPTTILNGQEFIALDDVASLFQVAVREDALAGGVTITYKGRTVVASTDQPMASVNGRVITLPAPVARASAAGCSCRSISCRARWHRSTTRRLSSAGRRGC